LEGTSGFRRRCLRNLLLLGSVSGQGRFRRHRLRNLPGQIKAAHLLEVSLREPASEAHCKVTRKSLQQLLAILRAKRTSLLLLDDPLADLSVHLRHQAVPRASCDAPRVLDHARDFGQHRFVALEHDCFYGWLSCSRHPPRVHRGRASSQGRSGVATRGSDERVFITAPWLATATLPVVPRARNRAIGSLRARYDPASRRLPQRLQHSHWV
jgi:hypothetical protein